MIKININKVRSTSANGTLSCDGIDDTVWDSWLDKLSLDKDTVSLDVDVEYCIEWDDDIPMVCVEQIVLFNSDDSTGTKWVDVTDLVDTEDTESQIQDMDDGSWAEDRIASLSDYYYDSYRDE